VVIVLFRSRLRPDAGEEYARMAEHMDGLARKMPGFVSFKQFSAPDGERVSVIEFESEETLAAWREHPEHRKAQARGREKFYEEYRLQVCSPVRDYDFKRDPSLRSG
jgi:heme-degrading monooxygenase HmoA